MKRFPRLCFPLALAVLAALAPVAAARPGSLDLSFGPGTVSAPGTTVDNPSIVFPGADFSGASSILVQSDGGIVAVSNTPPTSQLGNRSMVRFLPNGTVDPAFRPRANPGGNQVEVGAMALLPDGKFLLPTSFFLGGNSSASVSRFNPDGTDAPFPLSLTRTGWSTTAVAVAVQSDGKVLVAGGTKKIIAPPVNPFAVIYRFLPDGTPDTAFGAGGRLDIPGTFPTHMALAPDGKILIGTTVTDGTSHILFTRSTAEGALDATFGNGGILEVTPASGRSLSLRGLAVLSDGKLVAAGHEEDPVFGFDFTAMRFLPDGTPDPAFHGTGKVVMDLDALHPEANHTPGAGDDFCSGLAIQKDGKLLLAGHTGERFALVRLFPSGEPDPSFGTGGMVKTAVQEGNCRALSIALQPDGRIVTGGTSSGTTGAFPARMALARYLNPDPLKELAVEWPAGSALAYGGVVELGSVLKTHLEDKETTLTLRNTGASTLTGLTASLSGSGAAQFSIISPPAPDLPAGGVTALTVRFTPAPQVSSQQAVLAFKTDDAERGEFAVTVHGSTSSPIATLSVTENGVPVPAESVIAFGKSIPAPGTTRVFTLRNSGNFDLELQGISIVNAAIPQEFTVASPAENVLAPGAAFTLPVTFAPAGAGVRTAKLRVVSTDSLNPPFEVNLTGQKAEGIEAWRLTYFGTYLNEGAAADLSDPDHDGVPNLIEYATLTRPDVPGENPGRVEKDGNNLYYTVTIPTALAGELTYVLEWSDNPQTAWNSSGVTSSILSDDGTRQKVQFSLAAGTAGRRFVRLRVRR